MSRGQEDDARGVLWRVLSHAADLSGIGLLAIMLLVTVSVFFRYVLNAPILGSQEIIQIGIAVVVMLAMPYACMTERHIRVDILDPALGRVGRFVADIFARIVSITVLGFVVWKTLNKFWDAIEYADVTNMLEIPLWIAYGAIVIGMLLYALVLAAQLLTQLYRGLSDHE